MTESTEIRVHMTPEIFRRFANFDTFRVRKFYRSPLLFTLIMGAFGIVCLLMRDKPQASLLGGLLIGIGVVLPLVWFLLFRHSVSKQIKTSKLADKPLVYTLTLSDQKKGVEIRGTHGEEPLHLEWKNVHSAYRVKDCVYLYVTPKKAFLLPDADNSMDADKFFAFLTRKLEGRTADCR